MEGNWWDALSEREQKEIKLATYYSDNLAHGTTGHNQLMLIAKLAAKINEMTIEKDAQNAHKEGNHAADKGATE